MLKELEEMSIGQRLYNYECRSCGFEKGVPEFLIEEFRQDILFDFGAVAPLEGEYIPELSLNTKKLTTVRCQLM